MCMNIFQAIGNWIIGSLAKLLMWVSHKEAKERIRLKVKQQVSAIGGKNVLHYTSPNDNQDAPIHILDLACEATLQWIAEWWAIRRVILPSSFCRISADISKINFHWQDGFVLRVRPAHMESNAWPFVWGWQHIHALAISAERQFLTPMLAGH